MNAYWYFIKWGFKPRLNKVKASGGCHRFSEEIYRAELDKIWAQIRQGAFDILFLASCRPGLLLFPLFQSSSSFHPCQENRCFSPDPTVTMILAPASRASWIAAASTPRILRQ
ncbi:hypothetical protein [Siminovitchia terrae]|uniref:hypothetical protein n=1 Tax=Siminovitchia terrae TaxID=1914933 RepID=UPI001FED1CF3|nr:hypothetical protein [Siminovitchia terrae]